MYFLVRQRDNVQPNAEWNVIGIMHAQDPEAAKGKLGTVRELHRSDRQIDNFPGVLILLEDQDDVQYSLQSVPKVSALPTAVIAD